MIAAWSARLSSLYDLSLELDARAFLCDLETARALGADDAEHRREVLLVHHDAGTTHVSLYVDPRALALAGDRGWLGARERFEACCLAAEGLSHLVYVAFRDQHLGEVSELELELQAEIDKYALALLAPWPDPSQLLSGRGAPLVQLRDRSRRLRERLFAAPEFLDAPGTEQGDRYRTANRFAARYAKDLEARLIGRGRLDELARELRRFYRLGLREKLERLS